MESEHGPRKRAWSFDSFAAFWANPDPSRVISVLAPDVRAFWPFREEPFVGGDYVRPIEELVKMVPDLVLTIEARGHGHGTNFLRWSGGGTLEGSRFSFEGVDALKCDRGGQVIENRIFSCHPIFQALAERC